jgi:hypothetical protein
MSRVAAVKDTELVGVHKTPTPVLKAKALDSRLPDPILGDEYAERAMRRLDPDYDNRRFGTSQMGLAAVVRTKAHHDWARGRIPKLGGPAEEFRRRNGAGRSDLLSRLGLSHTPPRSPQPSHDIEVHGTPVRTNATPSQRSTAQPPTRFDQTDGQRPPTSRARGD